MLKGFFQQGAHDTKRSLSKYEDFLVADRSGLEHLRSKIDEVLSGSDEVLFDDEIVTDLVGIRVAELNWTWRDKAADEELGWLTCGAVAIIFTGLMGLGVWKIVELISGT